MYNRFFGVKKRPFKQVPNPEFLYLSRIHEEVLAHLNYAVGYGEGFVEVTGEVGSSSVQAGPRARARWSQGMPSAATGCSLVPRR